MRFPKPHPKEHIPVERMKVLEEAFELLLPYFEQEEFSQVPKVARSVWQKAQDIYLHTQSDTPFYIIFMTKCVSDRFQEFMCGFMVNKVKSRDQHPSVLKDCLVWFCDKKKGIFELETRACDSRSQKFDSFPCLGNESLS